MGSSDTDLARVFNSQCLWRQSLCPAQLNPGVPDLAQSSTAYGHPSIAKGKFHYTQNRDANFIFHLKFIRQKYLTSKPVQIPSQLWRCLLLSILLTFSNTRFTCPCWTVIKSEVKWYLKLLIILKQLFSGPVKNIKLIRHMINKNPSRPVKHFAWLKSVSVVFMGHLLSPRNFGMDSH